MKAFLAALVFLCAVLAGYGAEITASSPSRSDVVTALTAAAAGDTVIMPAGTATWTSGITYGLGIHLRGAGSGRVIGRSASSVAVGTGSKSFTTQAGLAITAGDTLRIERNGGVIAAGFPTGARAWMEGDVTSYSGTSLVMNITTTSGSGTHPVWIISTPATTTITHSTASGPLITLTESATFHTRLSGIRFVTGSASDAAQPYVEFGGSGKPVLIYDCYFESTGAAFPCLYTEGNRGVIARCSFPSLPISLAPLALQHKNDHSATAWASASTMGMDDTTGESNLYVEDCDFHAWLNAMDFDGNSKTVVRHCLFNNAGTGTHGADTGPIGVRHYEYYHNEFLFNGFGDGQTMPLNWWFYLRGGTGVIYDNIMPDIECQDYGGKVEVNMTVMNLQRNGGPNACWGANQPGLQYPAPRQVGLGRVTGTAGNDGSGVYAGDSEPLYIWGNTGAYSAGTTDYGGEGCADPDSSADYIVAGRDYFNNETSKPGWVPYPYPHPLRSQVESGPTLHRAPRRWLPAGFP